MKRGPWPSWIAAIAAFVACTPIDGVTRSQGPTNACPCEAYPRDSRNLSITCDRAPGAAERCVAGNLGTPPGYDFTIVVSVPDTSVYAAGQTFFATNADLSSKSTVPSQICKPPSCLALRQLVEVSGAYRVEADAAAALGAPFTRTESVPVRVTFFPQLGTPPSDARDQGFPADLLFAASTRVAIDDESFAVQYRRQLSTGTYTRIAYPEPPWDEIVPPAVNDITVARAFDDAFSLAAAQLDDATGLRRHATVQRDDGLDGMRIWLAETKTGRRVSVVKSLSGKKAEADLHTIGQASAFNEGLLDVIVAPPDTWIGVPRLKSTLIGGVGLKDIVYPALPQPVAVTGIVGSSESGVLTAVRAKLSFRSTSIRAIDEAELTLLEYTTTVSTDEAGGFATVLPHDRYDIVVEPEEGSGFSKYKQPSFEVRAPTLKIEPTVKRSVATGRAVLTDGRPLAEAEVLAVASKKQTDPAVVPRPGRTRTNADGTFGLELDRGDYEIWVEPQAGSGFPRVVTLRPIAADRVDLGRIDVPPPTRFVFDIKEPSGFSNPIGSAVVRAYARPACGSPPCPVVEIASTMTDQDGKCEILLAQQPR